MTQNASNKRKQLREHLKQGLILPGAYNALTAMQIEKQGFKGVYISGAGLSAQAGFSDTGILTRDEFLMFSKYILNSTSLPTICDADTGFGDIRQVRKTVNLYETLGLSGLHIEDQEFPKRCGHLDDKKIIPVKDMVKKIKAAVSAKTDPDFLIIARTDAHQSGNILDTLERAKAYVDAGADMIFPEALTQPQEFEDFSKNISVPLLANMTEFGKSPLMNARSLFQLGFKMVIYPVSALRMASKATENLYNALYIKGHQQEKLSEMQTREELYSLLKYQP